MSSSRGFEKERRLRRLIIIGGGWVAAGMMTCVAVGALAILWNHPVPQDRFHVSIQHDDGTYEPSVAREDLSASRRAMLLRHTVIEYVKSRENYSYEGVNGNYRKASVLSAPGERERYQNLMLDKRNPLNPVVLYGDGVNARIADVQGNIRIRIKPDSPNAVDALFVVKVTAPGQRDRMVPKTATMTWMPAEDQIPIETQTEYDPLGIAFTHYNSDINPDAPK